MVLDAQHVVWGRRGFLPLLGSQLPGARAGVKCKSLLSVIIRDFLVRWSTVGSFWGLESIAHQEKPAAPALPALPGSGVTVGTLNTMLQLKATPWRVSNPRIPSVCSSKRAEHP